MRTLWGTGANGAENKPSWLNDEEKERCYATASGWVLKHPGGAEELLVSVRGLSLVGKLGAATITQLKWATGSFKEFSTKTLKVTFNEKVAVTGTPTITITHGGGTVTGTYASINSDKTTVTFQFAVPAIANSPLSVAAQTIALAGGTIDEYLTDPTVNAERVVSADHVAALGTKAIAAAATPSAVDFVTGTYTAGTTKSVTVTFTGAVDVAVSNPTLIISGTTTASTTATYVSGTGTNALVFEFTVPVAAQTLSVAAQSIVLAGGSTIKESGDAVQVASLVISSAVATAAGTKTTV